MSLKDKTYCKWRDFEIEVRCTKLPEFELECKLHSTPQARLRFAEKILKDYQKCFKFVSQIKTKSHQECHVKSLTLLSLGNQLGNKDKYREAIAAYNLSLCFSCGSPNEIIATIYANRAQVYMKMGRYENSMKDILLAKENCSPGSKLIKDLKFQEKKCKNKTNPNLLDCNWKHMKDLSYEKNSEIPLIVNRLGIKEENSKFWVYAKEPIEFGAIIMIEEHINSALAFEAWHTNCHNCFEECENLIPCPNCVYALFCSENCMKKANENFHNWECPIMDLLFFFQDNLILIAFRTFLKMLNIFKDYNGLETYWKEMPKKNVNWYSVAPEKYDEVTHLQAVHSTLSRVNLDSHSILMLTITAAVFKREIMNYSTKLAEIFKTKEQRDFLGEIILQHLFIFHEIAIFEKGLLFDWDCPYAISYSVIQEMKWSTGGTGQNVNRQFVDGHLSFMSIRDIKKGEILYYLDGNDNDNDCDYEFLSSDDDEEEDQNEEEEKEEISFQDIMKQKFGLNFANVLCNNSDKSLCCRIKK